MCSGNEILKVLCNMCKHEGLFEKAAVWTELTHRLVLCDWQDVEMLISQQLAAKIVFQTIRLCESC